MSDLDDKVKLIIQGLPDTEGGIVDFDMDEGIEQIKQVLTEAGYVNTKAVGFEGFTVKNIMTGQEWYDRFAELIKDHGFYERVTEEFVHHAAKRAAGIEKETDDDTIQ